MCVGLLCIRVLCLQNAETGLTDRAYRTCMLYVRLTVLPFIIVAFLAVTTGVAQEVDLQAAGATFPFPLYERMFEAYAETFGVRVAYNAIGSGGGIQEMLEQTVDFAGTDRFLSDDLLEQAPDNPFVFTDVNGETVRVRDIPNQVLHVPMAVAAVVPVYNFEPFYRFDDTLVLSGKVLAEIYLGNVTLWNDPAIAALNPALELPQLPITVVYRADSSGTTSIFVDYLAKVSPAWSEDISQGPRTSVDWPTGVGGAGNGGVAELVQALPGAIGYVSLAYAVQNGLGIAFMERENGVVPPSSLAVARASDVVLPQDLRVTITNSDDPEAWPITGFTWLLLYQEQRYEGRNLEQAQQTRDLIAWMLDEGQNFHEPLNYGRITGRTLEQARAMLNQLTYRGQPLP